jgi:O-antigen chain-terminating bifunctional methyltransferase/kinase
MSEPLIEKVRALPEIYQPIFGHPELAENVSRQCEDRLRYLAALHDALREALGRPVRVLDLGCAQGYICLSLAARGAQVVGVDFLQANVDVCTELAAEHPQFDARFEHARLETFIESLEDNAFDLVLGLSVFHHVVHELGVKAAAQLMDRLAACVALGAFELAQAGEPLYWGGTQPKDARELLLGFAFVHELARFPTHLSDIQRPLYVASARYWYLDGHIHRFERAETDPHALARGTHQASRRYLFGGEKLAKLVRFDGPRGNYNKTEWQREVAALSNVPGELAGRWHWPTLDSFGQRTDQGWLVRSITEGELLLDLIRRGGEYDSHRVIGDVLEQLVILEREGRYHNDLRVWNALLTTAGDTLLIDYGAISDELADCSWPDDLFLSFFIFVHEVATRSVSTVAPYVVPPFISPFNIPNPYAGWLASFSSRPRQEWSFHLLRDTYAGIESDVIAKSAHANSRELWMGAVERHLSGVGHRVFHQDLEISRLQRDEKRLHAGLQQINERHEAFETLAEAFQQEASRTRGQFEQMHARLAAFEREVNGAQRQFEQIRAEQAQQESENRLLHAQWLASEQEQQRLQKQLDLVFGSFSFRITKPLRSMANISRKMRSMMVSVIRPLWHRMVHHAWGRRIGKMVFYPFPRLRIRLNQSIVAHVGHEGSGVPQNKAPSPGRARVQQDMKDDTSHDGE